MSYFFALSLKYMKRNKTRTLYSVFGIVLTFILCFVTMTVIYSVWEYSFLDSYKKNPYEIFSGYCTMENNPQNHYPKLKTIPDLKDTLQKISADSRVEKICLLRAADEKEIGTEELKKRDVVRILIKLKDVRRISKSAEEISADYEIQFDAIRDALIYNGQDDSAFTAFTTCVLLMIASIFGLLSAFILRNTMTIAVTERVRDYGVFRCIGMTENQLRLLLFAEGITMSVIASVLGAGIGFGGLKLAEGWIKSTLELSDGFTFVFYPKGAAFTVVLCVLVTLFSLIEPSRMAGKVTPADALKGIYTAFEKNRAIRKIDKKGGILGKLFKTPGLYAQRNILRRKGGNASVFSIMFFCIVFILTAISFTQTVSHSVKSFFNTWDVEYSETVSRSDGEYHDLSVYDEKKDKAIIEDLKNTENVEDVLPFMISEYVVKTFSPFSYDEKIREIEDRTTFLVEVGYTKEDIEKEIKYLTEGAIDYDEMVAKNGILVCNTCPKTEYKNAGFSQSGKKVDVKITDFKVGDTVKMLSVNGSAKAKKVFTDALLEAARKYEINAYNNSIGESVPFDEAGYGSIFLNYYDDASIDNAAIIKEIIETIRRNGYDLPEDIDENTNPVYILEAMKQIEFERGETETYTVMGIISGDLATGDRFTDSYGNYIRFVYPMEILTRRVKEISEAEKEMGEPVNSEGMVYTNGMQGITYGSFLRSEIGVKRTRPEKVDTFIRNYAQKNGLMYCNVYTDIKGMESDYADTFKVMKIIKVAAVMFGGFVILVCMIHIINSLQANMRLRKKEMWLYDVVGMSTKTKFGMLFIEYALSTIAAFVFGCIASFFVSFFSIKKLLDITDSFTYSWPFGVSIAIGAVLIIVLTGVIGLEIKRQEA